MPTPRLDLSHLKDDKLGFIEKLLTHPDGTPVVPHATQREVLTNIRRTTVLLAGRQWGKSTCLGWDGAWYATTHANRQVYCFAPTLDQAKIIWGEIADHFRRLPLKALVDGNIVEYPFPHLKLRNGTEIHARGTNSPQFLRGKRCHRGYGDENAFVKDAVMTDVVEPMFTVTGQAEDSALVLTSTPFGHGYFYETYKLGLSREDPDFISFRFTSEDNPYADKKFLARQKQRYGEDSLIWRTEYLAEFADSDLAVFPWTDIQAAYEAYPFVDRQNGRHLFPQGAKEGHRYGQGVDLANRHDWFVSAVGDLTDPLFCPLVRLDRHQRKGYAFYKGLIRANHAAYHGARTLVDATTLAESVVEDLADIGAEGYRFTGNTAKYEVVQELARMLAERRLAIPYDRTIIDELRFFEYKVTPAKVLRAEASRGHDDVVMALALLAHLALQPRTIGLFAPVDLDPRPAAAGAASAPGRDPIADLFAFDTDEQERAWQA